MNSRSCEEDLLFDEAVRKPAPPGTEDDVVMDESGSGQLDVEQMHPPITESLIPLNKVSGLMKMGITFEDMCQSWHT